MPTERDVRVLLEARGGKFSKLEAVYTAPSLPPDAKTGLPFNFVQGLGVVCSRCVFYLPDRRRCQAVGLPGDWGGEEIDPNGLSRFYIAKQPRLIDKSLQSVYIPEVTLRKLGGLR